MPASNPRHTLELALARFSSVALLLVLPACLGGGGGGGADDECASDNDCGADEVCDDGDCVEDPNALCDGCCFDPATDCRASEVCRFSNEDIENETPGACVGAEGLPYLVALLDVQVCERNTDGTEWDVGAGAPDPQMLVEVNGVGTMTVAVQDTFNPGTFALELELRSTDRVNVFLMDEDLTEADFISGFCVGPECDAAIGVDLLRGLSQQIGDGCDAEAIASGELFVFPAPN